MLEASPQLLAALLTDDALRARFRKDPAAVLAEHGFSVPAGISVRVLEDTATVRHLVIPYAPPGESLQVEELAARASKIIF